MQRAATLSAMSTSLRRRSPFLSLLGLLCTLSMLSGCSGDEPEAPKQTGTARPAAERVEARCDEALDRQHFSMFARRKRASGSES